MKSKSNPNSTSAASPTTSNQIPPSNPIGVNLRIQIIKARNLTAKDRNGKSDPFVVTSLPGSNPPAISSTSSTSTHSTDSNPNATWKKQTPVVPKQLDPEWKISETTYDLPILNNWLAGDDLVSLLEGKRLEVARAIASQDGDGSNIDSAIQSLAGKVEGEGEGVGNGGDSKTSESTPSLDVIAPTPITENSPPAPFNSNSNSNSTSNDESVLAHDTVNPSRPTMTTRHSSKLAYLSSSSKKLLSAPVRLMKVPASRISLSRNNSSNHVPMALASHSTSNPNTNGNGNGNGNGGRRRAPRPMTIRRRRRRNQQQQQQQQEKKSEDTSVTKQQGSLGNVEFVLWDHDRFTGNDYLGEVSLDVSKWSSDGEGVSARWEHSKPIWLPLVSSRRSAKVSGELQVRIGLVSANETTSSSSSTMDLDEVYQRLVLAATHPLHLGSDELLISDEDDFNGEIEAGNGEEDQARLEVRHIPASESVGTSGPAEAFLDDGLSSGDSASEDGDSSDDEEDDLTATEGEETDLEDENNLYDEHYKSIAGVPTSASSKQSSNVDATASAPSTTTDSDGTKVSTTPSNVSQRRKVFGRKTTTSSGVTTQSSSSTGSLDPTTQQPKKKRLGRKKKVVIDPQTGEAQPLTNEKRVRRKKSNRRKDFSFKAEMGKDIIGIVMMEVKGAKELPRWMNMTHTSFDMDPFTIVSFGQKIFRTRVARHTLNPVWDEKLLFHVRRHETNFQAKFSVYDWDKMSSNDHVGSTSISIKELIEAAPKPDPESGLYAADEDANSQEMKSFTLQLAKREGDDDHKYGSSQPTLTVEAKFTPYDALRQRLWRQVLKQYDTNDSGTISTLEMTSMLDSLGSTLSNQTLHSWWEAVGKKPDEDELSFEESIAALEREIQKPWSEKRYVSSSSGGFESGIQTPGEPANSSNSSGLDLVGHDAPVKKEEEILADKQVVAPSALTESDLPPKDTPLTDSTAALSLDSEESIPLRGREGSSSSDASLLNLNSGSESVERVIRLKSCPLCHMPRLNSKAEVDIVTHLAVCASHDWRRVDSMTSGVSNFVTASQAHRKWYTKVVTKISQGSYQLGADSANIIVQDRISGELLEEKMQVYVRLGIRLLYRGAKSRMEGNRIKKMLKNMSIKQGLKFDNPNSVRDIAPFIAFHQLNMEEVLDPLESFKNFNEFFYRKLKPDARPNDDPNDPTTLVSGADCRMMAFESVESATKIWIKGKEFSIERLLGDDYKGKLDKYKGGSLSIFRLAPQDYHRFHVPVDAKIGEIKRLDGQYYTVNPMAVRSSIDIYGENIRSVVPFHSKEFGTVFQVCIGAMMVGSTVFTAESHQEVKRGDELGYYKFGGSTNILLFEKGRNQFDQDLLDNSSKAIETLVRVGMKVGKALKPDAGVTTP